jgi:hypothetical protein
MPSNKVFASRIICTRGTALPRVFISFYEEDPYQSRCVHTGFRIVRTDIRKSDEPQTKQ